jgi:hypothetical protein
VQENNEKKKTRAKSKLYLFLLLDTSIDYWILLQQPEPLSQKERLRHRLHGHNPQRGTVPSMGHDRGLHRGVPHSFKQRRRLRPPLSQEIWHGGSAYSHHNPTVAGGCFGHPVYDDGSTAGTGTVTGHSFEQRVLLRRGNEHMPVLGNPVPSGRRGNDGASSPASKRQSWPHRSASLHPRQRGS